ncbi:MAG: hypothetical protein Q8P36_02865 [bacterium]|nr:hypothetical protein [bacterium]
MPRVARPQTLNIAVDVEGASRGPQFLTELAKRFSASEIAGQLRVPVQFVPVSLAPHTQATFIREAIPRAAERAKQVLEAMPGITIGIGIVPALYAWRGDLWSFSLAYAADWDGPLYGTTSRSPEDTPDEMLADFNVDANAITDKLIPDDAKDTPERRSRLQLAIVLCQLAVIDLAMKVPVQGNGNS